MKKQRKQLILLVIVLLLLVAGYFGVQKYNEVQSNQQEEEPSEMVIDIASEGVTEISYVYEGETLSFVKEEDTWRYKEDTSLNITQSRINTMVSTVSQLASQGKIETVVELSDYGLDEPAKEITFVAAGQTYEILLGDYNSMTSVYYITTDGGSTVHAVESTLSTAFSYTLDELIEEEESTEEAEESSEATTTE